MPKINKLSQLFTAIGNHDIDRAQRCAGEIVSEEEKKGHHSAAKLLKGSLQPNRHRNSHQNGNYHSPSFPQLISEALAPQRDHVAMSELVLPERLRQELEIIKEEWSKKELLRTAGIRRRSRLFFYGPPGCGKSATAKALGTSIGLPVYIVRFDGVIGAYLGQTAINLRELFRFAEYTPCILVFDEVDALAKTRGNPLDIGELDRIVIAFMQELEHTTPAGLVVATSNLPGQIDPALWRRFDLTLEFPSPRPAELTAFVSKRAKLFGFHPPKSLVTNGRRAKNFAQAEKLVEAEARNRILLEQFHQNGRRKSKP